MELKHALRPGMRVFGTDNRDYGEIERHDDAAVYVGGQSIPYSAIERLDQDRIYVRTGAPATNLGAESVASGPAATGGSPLQSTAGSTTTSGNQTGDLGSQTRIPIFEEQLELQTRVVDLGEILVHKTVDAREEVRRGPLSHEEVEVERIQVNRPVSEPEQRRQEGDWLIIPIMEEIFVVQKQLMVKEEIRIRKQLVTEEHEVRETIRTERASIEDTRPARPARQTAQPAAAVGRDDDAAWEALHAEIRDTRPQA